jgi:hypothetical protein
MSQRGQVDLILLLYADRSDPVSAVILDHPERFQYDVATISFEHLLNQVAIGPVWQWANRTIDPSRTAVVNRLPSSDWHDTPARLTSFFQQQQLWTWLHEALRSFAYASSIPSPSSLIGCHGSLLDQWLDLPDVVRDLRVPVYEPPWEKRALRGDVYVVDPWRLYSLGAPLSAEHEVKRDRLVAYVRPDGMLVHVAQIGGTIMFVNAPLEMTPSQRNYIVSFCQSMALSSPSRILEHAFFVDNDLPVFYSTCPLPVLSGHHSAYADLLVEGLHDDIERRRERAPA